jgi:hypothetical protein
MAKSVLLATLLALAACSGMPPPPSSTPSPCATNPGGYDCQVEMYMKVGGP